MNYSVGGQSRLEGRGATQQQQQLALLPLVSAERVQVQAPKVYYAQRFEAWLSQQSALAVNAWACLQVLFWFLVMLSVLRPSAGCRIWGRLLVVVLQYVSLCMDGILDAFDYSSVGAQQPSSPSTPQNTQMLIAAFAFAAGKQGWLG